MIKRNNKSHRPTEDLGPSPRHRRRPRAALCRVRGHFHVRPSGGLLSPAFESGPHMPGTPAAPLHSTRPFPPQRQGRTKSTRRTRTQRRVRGRSRGTSRPEGRTTARRFPHGHSRDRAFVLGHVFIWTRTCKGTLGVRPSGPLLASEGAVQRILTGDHSSHEEIQKQTWKELRGRSSESGPLRPRDPALGESVP